MDFLTKLLAIEVPENTALQSAELSFRGFLPWWLALVITLLLGAGIFLLYWREKTKISTLRRAVMAGLRTLALALLLFLLFRPVLLAEFKGERPRGVALLLDNSQSMKQQDRRLTEADKLRVAIAKGLVPVKTSLGDAVRVPSETPKDPARADLVKGVLTHADLKFLESLQKHGPLRPYLFGQSLRGALEESSTRTKDQARTKDRLLAAFSSHEEKTGLADSIQEILQKKDGDLPTAIVVISDGQDNASKFTLEEAARESARWQVPLHIYGVGTAEGGSLQLKEVTVPDTIFFEDAISVPLRWRAQGFKEGKVEITLNLGGKLVDGKVVGGKEVARKEIAVQTGEDLRDVLTFTPEKQGKEKEENLDLIASIRFRGNDQFRDGMVRPIRVVDSKIRVLVIEGSPRWEYKFLQPLLLRDKRVEPTFLLVNADPKVLNAGPPFIPALPPTRDKFFDAKYNLIILGDVPAGYLGKEHMEWIQEFVKNRGGLIVMAGRQHLPSGYDKTPLAEVLPVEFNPVKFSLVAEKPTQEFPPTLTEVGQRTDMLALADTPEENLKLWASLPGFYWHYPVTKLRPGATPLIVNPREKMGDQPMPIMASQYYGKGPVLFLACDETWRWRFNAQDKHFARFWGQIIYQMGLPSLLGDSSKRVHMALERSQAILHQQGSIFVRLLDKDFNPRKDPQVEAVLEYLDAKPGQERSRKLTLHAIPGRDGEYRALLSHDLPGRWEIKVNNPETTTFPYRVDPPPRHELEEAGLAEQALRQAAQVSGGKFYREEDLHQLSADIKPRKAAFTRRQEVILWNPLTLILFVGLVTAEWLIRKFSDLS